MIPIELHIKNFLSYGEEPQKIDLSQVRLACLSGLNGHGKSAFLDALTWVLWDKARNGISTRQLLRIGARDMEVDLTFDLEGQRYRVMRRYRQGGTTRVEFHLLNNSTAEWVNLTTPGKRETDRKIADVLRMEYSTFINSCFLVQGRANEFSRKGPADRKRVLEEILNLNHYERLAELARKKARETKIQLDLISHQLGADLAEIKTMGDVSCTVDQLKIESQKFTDKLEQGNSKLVELRENRTQLVAEKRELENVESQIELIRAELKDLINQKDGETKSAVEANQILADREQVKKDFQLYEDYMKDEQQMTRKLVRLRDLERSQSQLERAVENIKGNLEINQTRLFTQKEQILLVFKESDKLLSKRQEVEKGYADLIHAKKQEENKEFSHKQYEILRESQKTIDSKILRDRSRLEAQLEALRQKMADLKVVADQEGDLTEQLKIAKEKITGVQKLKVQHEETIAMISELGRNEIQISVKHKLLKENQKEDRGKIALLEETEEAHCPLCELSLDNDRRNSILEGLSNKVQSSIENTREVKAELRRLREEQSRLDHMCSDWQKDLDGEMQVRHQMALVQSARDHSVQAKKDFERTEMTATELQSKIEGNFFNLELQHKFDAVLMELKKLAYDREEHRLIRTKVSELQYWDAEKARLKEAQQRRDDAEQLMPEVLRPLTELTAELEGGNFAASERQKIEELTVEITGLEYNARKHQSVQVNLKLLTNAPQKVEQIRSAMKQLNSSHSRLDLVETTLVKRKEHLQNLFVRKQSLSARLEQIGKVQTNIKSWENEIKRTEHNRQKSQALLVAANLKLARVDQLEKGLVDIRETQQNSKKSYKLFGVLAEAFGKDGIPALIIENAVPEIESEANALLSRLTEGRISLFINLERETGEGEARETLDIGVSDELGIRSYELYSGGEAFRIDLALRVALSKLVAGRAGIPLRTLIIDEGFGTQDTEGLRNMVNALQEISKDFDRLLVVTHLESVKDAFPTRIEVTKHPELGSRLELIHV